MIVLYALAAALGLGVLWLGSNLRVIKQYERGVVYRFGRVQTGVRPPGLTWLIPIADRLDKVNMQIITMPIPAQDGITRDNVTVRVDAVIYFNVADPVRAAVDVQDYMSAVGQVAQTSLRSIIGKSNLDDLLSNREGLNQGLELMIDSPALGWGIHIDRVEIKDVVLPDSMKRSMSRQAEAERERRARVITADGELQASDKLAQAAEVMAEHPAALQLRLLQTVVEVAAEKNSTLVLPFPGRTAPVPGKGHTATIQAPRHGRHDVRRTRRATQRQDAACGHPTDPRRPSRSAPRKRCGPAIPAEPVAPEMASTACTANRLWQWTTAATTRRTDWSQDDSHDGAGPNPVSGRWHRRLPGRAGRRHLGGGRGGQPRRAPTPRTRQPRHTRMPPAC